MMSVILEPCTDVDTSSWYDRVRFYLIELLAGRAVILLNAKITIIYACNEEALVHFKQVHNLLAAHNHFIVPDGLGIIVTEVRPDL